MTALIDLRDLTKVYRDGTAAVDGVSLEVEEGEAYGFLGPNGAGKTTVIRILVTLLPKTSGWATVAGVDVSRHGERVRRLIGYAAQFVAVDRDLTVRENLVLQARLQGMRPAPARRRSDELLEEFDLAKVAGKRADVLSGGMRRRLDLAQALVHRPPLIFLDEPTTGLDLQTRTALWRHLEEINRQGTTIFLTTQYLEEADRLCHRLAIIDHGKVAVIGAPAALKEEAGQEVVTAVLDDRGDATVARRAQSALQGLPGGGDPVVGDHSVTVPVKDASRRLSEVVRRLDDCDVAVLTIAVAKPSLDDVFLKYTGERLQPGGGTDDDR